MFRRAARAAVAVFAMLVTVSGAAASATGAEGRSLDDVTDPEVHELVGTAVQATDALVADSEVRHVLQRALGVFLIPNYGGEDMVHGQRGGYGVALARTDGAWGNPAFYTMGSLSVTAEARVEAGPLALLLMNDEAVDFFRQERSEPVSPDREDSGLTIVSVAEWAETGTADAVLWSPAGSAFEGDIISLADVAFDHEVNAAYYGAEIGPAHILAGLVEEAPENVIAKSLQ